MATIAEALARAVHHHQAGNLAQAEQLYRQILRLRPDLPEAHHKLGSALASQGKLEEAQACYTQALRIKPDFPEALNHLGAVLAEQGHIDASLASFREALRLRPDYADALNHLGAVLVEQGRLEEGLASLEEALRLRPDLPEAHYHLGMALAAREKLGEALACYEQAVRINPNYKEALNNRGNVLQKMRRLAEAEASYRDVVRLAPDEADARNNLGGALAEQGRLVEALASYQEALRFRPDFPEAHYNRGLALAAQGKQGEAQACFEQALRLKPNYAEALDGLATAYKEQWLLEEAIACCRKAIAVKPEVQYLHSNLLFALLYQAGNDPEYIFAEHLRWAKQVGSSPDSQRPLHPNRDPGRRLRVGYVSPDFREHVVGRYSEAVIGAHDRGQFEVFCYANVRRPDALTARLKTSADRWRFIWGLSDARVVDLIFQEQIDVLVDLAGHTGDNRLGVFAKKPAPIQATHCGYPATTGLAAIDYRLTDASCDPPGRTERFHSERLVRLPDVYWCYQPPSGQDVSASPARRPGEVTFGSFNNLCKVTREMIGIWSQILNGLPGSRMVVVTGAGRAADDQVLATFGGHGVGPERLRLVGRQGLDAYFRLYQGVDICLDTYPFTGCNTTADALWMGVPVVSLAGPAYVSRQGVAILVQVGLGDLVAETPAAYVEAATRLARDLPRLHELRSQLRGRLENSPLVDVPRFTRALETAYRRMWECFCRGDQGDL